MIRVALVDDHPVVRLGLRVALTASTSIRWVGDGTTLEDARRIAAEAKPDLLLLDLRLPDGRAIDAIGPLLAERPELRVVLLTGSGTAEDAREALRRGARGYLTKDDLVETIVDSVNAVMRGEIVVAPAIRLELKDLSDQPVLSEREREVLTLVAEGCTNPEISRMLGISTGTVRTHVSNILEKLGVADRTEATSVALRRGLL